MTRWILKTSKGFTRVGFTMINKSVRAYVYLSLTSQVQARLKTVGKTANALDAQNIYMNSFEELLKSDYSIADDIARYQGVLEHAMSKVDFSVGGGIYMLPSNMNLNINKTQGFNNNILIAESSYKLGLNNRVNAMAKQKTATKTKKLRDMRKFQFKTIMMRRLLYRFWDCFGYILFLVDKDSHFWWG